MTDKTGISNNVKLIQMIYRFLAFVRMKDGIKDGEGTPLSFQDKNSYLGKEENYKARTFSKAQDVLQSEKWTEDWIGSGKILTCVRRALDLDINLVFPNQKFDFMNRTDPEHENYKPEAERALYHIYKSKGDEEEAAAFAEAIEVFGGKYDTISYLFFIKDSGRFLPVSPGNFERSLASVGIEYKLQYRCGWENYQGFLDILKGIRDVMQDILPSVDLRLIDAHTFLWVIQEKSDEKEKKKVWFLDWTPDSETAAQIEEEVERHLEQKATGIGGRKSTLSSYYSRSAEVVRITRERAKGICQLCGQPAPFMDKKGEPYLEVHHVMWLSRGGADDTDNTVALCPNCHAKMHVVDDPGDVEKLMSLRS